jgi:ABC-2 type transport system permease protein
MSVAEDSLAPEPTARFAEAHDRGQFADSALGSDVGDSDSAPGETPASTSARRRHRPSARFLSSELVLIFGRRRNWAGMAVLASVPIIINVAVKLSSHEGGGGGFLADITQNGLFAALTALTLELPLFLPLAVAAIAADSVAGEANLGTLRYLLTVPVARTRLLVVKYLAIVIFALAATLLVAGVGAGLGLMLFGGGKMMSLSGTQISFGAGVWRLALVCLYIAACLAALGAIGLFVSTLTEQPIGATVAILILGVGSEIVDSIPDLSAIHPYLPTHYWLGFGDLLRDPIATDQIRPGLMTAAVYVLVFWSAAWARFGSRDVSG